MRSGKWRALIEDCRMLACLYAARFIVWRELRRRRREGAMLPRRAHFIPFTARASATGAGFGGREIREGVEDVQNSPLKTG